MVIVWGGSALAGAERGGEAPERVAQGGGVVGREGDAAAERLGHVRRPLAQRDAGRREVDQHAALVGLVARAGDERAPLQPLEQGGERARVEAERLPELADRARRALPEGEQRQVLRV